MPRDISPHGSKRYSHGIHLTPQDASTDRTRRRRHKHSPSDREQRPRSSDRGYRSENEPRRRHGEDHDRERHRANSTRRPLMKEHGERRRRRSINETDESDDGRPHEREQPRSRGHEYEEHRLHRDPNFVKPRARDPPRSRELPYGEHRFDPADPIDDYPESRLHRESHFVKPNVFNPPSHQLTYGEHMIDGHPRSLGRHDTMQFSRRERVSPSDPHLYGDHRFDIPVGGPDSSPTSAVMPPITGSMEGRTLQMYGDHHIIVNANRSKEEENTTVVKPGRLKGEEHVSSSTDEDEWDEILSSDHDEPGKNSQGAIVPSTSASRPRMHGSDDARAPADRDNAFSRATDNSINPQDRTKSFPSVAGPEMAQVPDAQLPRFSVSQYPPDFTRSLSNIVTPGDSRSEIGINLERPRSASASSYTSMAGSQSLSMSGSGVLGPKSYQYAPLKDLEFRLVRVLPERMWKLKCEILHVSVDNAPEYIAISYAWGDGVDTRSLLLEGANIPVAVSLHDALRAVRRKKEEILVWVDALCIDQQNKDERSEQVRLMGHIYSRAMSVAIWIGPEFEESELAVQLLQKMARNPVDTQYIKAFHKNPDSLALFNLFKRDYWKRLWVVQEVSLAKSKMVYCGYSMFPWEVYRQAAEVFWDKDSDPHIRQGPASFPELESLWQLGDESLLEVMRACRKKLSENPRDKVFGVLGMLPEATQREFPVDYSQSVKTVYMDVVDYLISTTDQLDVIRESIHFPLHVNSLSLPSWCPDWSHIPEVSGLNRTLNFAASRSPNGPTKAQYRFHDERRKLEISAITLDSVMATGVAVGTFCAAQDYLMAFLQWRAVILHELKIEEGNESHPMHTAFCRTLCLGQVPEERNEPQVWRDLCYHVFASLIRERLPRLPIDEDLRHYADVTGLIEPDARRKFLQENFGNRMMGRSLCITDGGLIGLGSGYMTAGDVVVVPYGCSTPILIRPENRLGEYRYVGDVYIDGYMHGEAVAQMEAGDRKRVVSKFKLC